MLFICPCFGSTALITMSKYGGPAMHRQDGQLEDKKINRKNDDNDANGDCCYRGDDDDCHNQRDCSIVILIAVVINVVY